MCKLDIEMIGNDKVEIYCPQLKIILTQIEKPKPGNIGYFALVDQLKIEEYEEKKRSIVNDRYAKYN